MAGQIRGVIVTNGATVGQPCVVALFVAPIFAFFIADISVFCVFGFVKGRHVDLPLQIVSLCYFTHWVVVPNCET